MKKIIIFSQWKKMADIINRELSLMFKNTDIFQVDGSTKEKMDVVEQFKKSTKNSILIATNTLNYGVSIPEADTVILFDLDFVPSILEQKIGRIDRVTQKNKMLIIKLIMQDSIEERVLEILSTKTDIFNESIDSLEEQNVYKSLFKPKSI